MPILLGIRLLVFVCPSHSVSCCFLTTVSSLLLVALFYHSPLLLVALLYHSPPRLWSGAASVEITWTVGPLPADTGREVVVRYTTDLRSNDTWFTDANGRGVMQRQRNQRPSYKTALAEPVAGNYYPITSGVHIQEPGRAELTVSVDRACGALCGMCKWHYV